MSKPDIMKELLERYEQLKYIDERNQYILNERIRKLEKMLKEML